MVERKDGFKQGHPARAFPRIELGLVCTVAIVLLGSPCVALIITWSTRHRSLWKTSSLTLLFSHVRWHEQMLDNESRPRSIGKVPYAMHATFAPVDVEYVRIAKFEGSANDGKQ